MEHKHNIGIQQHCAKSYFSTKLQKKLQHSSAQGFRGIPHFLFSSTVALAYLFESHSYHWDFHKVTSVAFHHDLAETVGTGH